MSLIHPSKRVLAIALFLPLTTAAWSAETSRGRVVEEVVVTAQRKAEQLHDVPISMSAFGGDFLREQGITDLEGATAFIPNVRIDSTGNDLLPNMRGFASNTFVTRGQEQPVGLAIDEVPYGRTEYFQSGLFDLQRLEALRGPQGQLFGANTTVGLINLTTEDPSEELTGFVAYEQGELGRERLEAAIGGGILPGFLHARVAILTDKRKGFVKNTTASIVPAANESHGSRDREGIRLKLDFPDLLGGSLLLSYQRDKMDYGDSPRELTFVPERVRGLLRQYDPNVDFEQNNVVSLDTPGFLHNDIDTFVARGQYDIGEWALNLVLGWSKLDASAQNDADGAPWPAAFLRVDESSEQTTFELRTTSPELTGLLGMGSSRFGSTDFTTGVFYQRRIQRPTVASTGADPVAIAAITAASNTPEGQIPVIPGIPNTGRPPPGEAESAFTHFEQESDAVSIFGQLNWHITDRWTLFFGARVDETSKEAIWQQVVEPDTAVVIPLAFDEFEDEDSRDERQVSPKIGTKFDLNEDLNFYATWTRNFQAAGYNSFGASAEPEARKFDASDVEAWEMGFKAKLFDQTAELNLGLFWMDLVDFQLFTTEVTEDSFNIPKVRIVNIGELRARGVELDYTWLPNEWLTLRGAVGYNDTELISFPIGTCFTDRANTDGDSEPRCDLSGGPFPQAPRWDVSFTPSIRTPLGNIPGIKHVFATDYLGSIELMAGINIQYVDERFLNDTLDERTKQPSFMLLKGHFGFSAPGQNWTLQITVENITDEKTANFANEAAVASGMTFRSPNPGRLAYGSFRWRF